MDVTKTTHSTIAQLRTEFLKENNIQFVLDKCHRYGWADTYGFNANGRTIGYGCMWGKDKREDRDAIFEFYITEAYREMAEQFFIALCTASNALYIECQTNDRFLYAMFEKFADDVKAEAILFVDDRQTNLHVANASVAARPQPNSDDCQYMLMYNGEVVGEGGFMLNYNFPYADMYYSVKEPYRNKGLGSFFVQELKREIYLMGRVPAARCNVTNMISKATLLKAGMTVCGERLTANLKVL